MVPLSDAFFICFVDGVFGEGKIAVLILTIKLIAKIPPIPQNTLLPSTKVISTLPSTSQSAKGVALPFETNLSGHIVHFAAGSMTVISAGAPSTSPPPSRNICLGLIDIVFISSSQEMIPFSTKWV